MTSKIQENTTTEISNTIKVIDATLVFSEYHAECYRNHTQNKNSYIVTHDNGDEQYIDCLLLSVNIFDYLNVNEGIFSTSYLREFDLFHHNGFLGVHYYGQDDKQNLKNFFNKYDKYFIKDFKPYTSYIIVELKDRVIELHDKIIKEIKIRDNLGELFWNR